VKESATYVLADTRLIVHLCILCAPYPYSTSKTVFLYAVVGGGGREGERGKHNLGKRSRDSGTGHKERALELRKSGGA
jgi:hypothetical protein